jgi:hypothetical protein
MNPTFSTRLSFVFEGSHVFEAAVPRNWRQAQDVFATFLRWCKSMRHSALAKPDD